MVVRAENNALAESTQKSVPSKLFDEFVQAQTCNQIFATFHNLCQAIDIVYPPLHSSTDHCLFYPRLKQRLSDSWKAESLWKKLDKRFYGKEYFVNPKSSLPDGKRIGESHKVLIIGAGPCGLRTAIEMACLGVKAVVVEKRDNFSRNNVLHLWPFIITDLKTLGAKIFHGKFCAGAIDHISIRQLQLILLKVTLLLGVEVVVNVGFEHLSCPVDDVIREDGTTWHKGWSATVSPSNHHISNFEFDVIVGADGKRNTLQGFKRKEFRGKLAIGLTVNFINRRTTAEAKVQEISGVAYIFNQQFFKDLLDKTNIDLENIVYYKGETHYFVMTVKKHSLITKGVLKQDYDDTEKLLCYANVDQEALGVYAREAADFSTNYKLPNLEFAINQYGQPDIALFDFTCMYAAENAAMFQEVKGRKLLSCLVGDSLLEPFWPMGTGCARGFLAAFDLVWMVRRLCLERGAINNNNIVTADSNLIELEALAERESVYRLLHHSTPQNTAKNWAKYTIDPSTRYTNLNRTKVSVKQVRRLYLSDRDIAFNRDEDEEEALIEKRQHKIDMQVEEEKKHPHLNQALTRKVSLVRSNKLLTWCRRITAHYDDIVIRDMTSSWKSGLALSAIIHQFRPDLISWEDLDPAKVEENNQLAFDVAEKYFGISPVMTGKEMASCQEVDKLVMVTYISQFYEVFKNETPAHDHKRGEQAVKNDSLEPPKSPLSSTSPVGLLIRFTNHIKRKSEKSKHDDPAKKKKLGGFFKKKENSSLATEVIHENKENEGIESAGTLNVGGTVVQLRNKDPELTASGQNNVNVNSQRTSNRISALSSQLMSQFEQNAPLAKPYSERVTSKQVSIPDESMSDKCYFCERRIYIVERMSAEGLFFHRQCFVCSHCGVTLRRGNYEFLSDTGKFFCKAHYMAHSGAFKTADQKRAEATDSITNKASNTLTTLKNEGAVKLRHPSLTTGSRRTPERIELENIRMSMINQPQRQLSEEAVNQHNLSTGASAVIQERIDEEEAEDDYDIDDFMSESSDDDIDWEAMLREANQLGDNNFTNDSDFGSRGRSASESSSRGGGDVTVIYWLHDGSYIEKPEPATNCQEESEMDDLNTMADLSGEEISEDPSPIYGENDDSATNSSSSSNVSMADVDFGSDGEIPLKPVATPRVSIRASKPNTLPRSCRPGKFTLPESDAAFRQLFQGVALADSKEPQPIDGFEPRECLFLSVAEMEVQRNQLAVNSNPAKCPVSYLPKNELTMLSNDEESNPKDSSMHEAIHKWLSGCMGSEANHKIAEAQVPENGRHNRELGTTSDSSDSDNEKKTISMSSSSSVSHVDDNKDCLSLLKDVPQKQESEKPTEETTMKVEEPHEHVGDRSSDNDSLDDYLLSSLSTASQSSLPNFPPPGLEEKQVAKAVDTNILPTEAVVAESQPVKKPRTIFNLLSSPTQEDKVLIPDEESRNNREEVDIPDKKTSTNEEKELVMEDEDPVVEFSNPFQKNPSHSKAGGSSVESNKLEPGVTNVLRKEDTMDRVHQYLLQNPVGGNSTNEDDDLAFSDGLTGEEDVELSSESSSSSASEFNTATLDVTELLEDSSNQRTTVQATAAMTGWVAGAKTTNSVLLRAGTSARNDNTSVWSNLPDETLATEQASQPPDASYAESFISAYNPGRDIFADESARKPRPPPERTSSFDSLEHRLKSRLSERNKWFRQTKPETADAPPVGAGGDAPADRTLPAKPEFGSDVDDSPTEPSAPPQTPGVGIQITEASPLDSLVTTSAQLGLSPASRYDSDSDQFFTPMAQTPLTRRPDHTTSPLASPPGTRHVLNQLDDLQIAENDARSDQPTSFPEESQLSANRRLPPTPPTSANSTLNRRSLPALPKIAHLEALSPTGSPQSPQSSAHVLSSVDEQLRARELRVQQRVEKLKAQTVRRKSDAAKSSSSIDEVDFRVQQTPPTTADDSNPPSTQSASCDISYSGDSPKPKRKNSFRQKLRRMHKKKDTEAPVEHKMRRALPIPNLAAKSLQKSTETTSPIESTPKQKSAEKKKKRGKLRRSKSKAESTVTTGSGTESGGAKKQTNPKGTKSLFRLSPKKKDKLKRSSQVYEVDGMTTLERKYPVQSERERAILRGERVRLLPDIPGESVNVRRIKERSSTLDSAEDDPRWRKGSSSKKRSNTISGLTAAEIDAKITRRVQIAARRQAKMEAQKRLRRAQVIQRQLEEVEVKQRELEERGVTLEKLLRDDGDDTERDDSQCMQEWFRLVQDKNALLRYENELMIYQRELQLEDVQSQLQQDLRERMAMDDKRKTSAELAQEKEILRKMLDVVEQRDELVGLLEEQRLKEKDEAVDMETLMLSKFNAFSQEPRDDTSSDSVMSTPRALAVT